MYTVNSKKTTADEDLTNGRYGEFGGCFVPEMLIPAMQRLQRIGLPLLEAESFQQAYQESLRHFVGRPTALTFASR